MSIEVKALRQPVDKSYRRMVQGVALFEEMRALAPQAELRFKVLPRKPSTDLQEVPLVIRGETVRVALELAPDQTFMLPRLPQAIREDAVVRSERRAQSLTWRAEVRTPGLPGHTRRLGDLRLECLVGMEAGLVSQYPSRIGRLLTLFEGASDYCGRPDPRYLFFAERPVFAVTLRHGARAAVLPVDRLYGSVTAGDAPSAELEHCDCEALLDRAYALPLGDTSWPDDTRIEIEYMDVPQVAPARWVRASDPADAIGAGTPRAVVLARLGEGRAVRFTGGYEVSAYRYGAAGQGEFVMLFNPEGAVAKTRLRPAPG